MMMMMIWKKMMVDGQDWSGVASGGHRSWPDPRKGFLPPPPCDLLQAKSQSEHCSSWSEGADAFVNAENVEDAGRVLTCYNSKSFFKKFSSSYSWPSPNKNHSMLLFEKFSNMPSTKSLSSSSSSWSLKGRQRMMPSMIEKSPRLAPGILGHSEGWRQGHLYANRRYLC